MKRKLVSGILVCLVLLLVALPLSACGPKTEETPTATTPTTTAPTATTPAGPEKPDSVKVGIMGGMTGPAAAAVTSMFQEIEYVVDYINEVDGGIDGVPIELKIVDNKGTLEGAALSYKEISAWDPVMCMVVEDYYYLGSVQLIAEDQMPVLSSSAIVAQAYVPPGVFYCVSLPVADGLGAFLDWVKADYKGEGNPKVGLLYWDLASGQQYQMAIPYAMQIGVDLEPVQYGMASQDLKPQLIQLKEADVDYIWMMATTPQASLAVRDVRGLDLDIPFCFNEYVEPNVLIDLAGAGAEGFLQYRSEDPWSEGSEATELYTKVYEKATGSSHWSDNRISITAVAAMVAALNQAVADVGWDNLSSGAVMAALNKLDNIDTWGNVGQFGFGPDRRLGISQVKMSRYTADGTVAISDWIDMPHTFEATAK